MLAHQFLIFIVLDISLNNGIELLSAFIMNNLPSWSQPNPTQLLFTTIRQFFIADTVLPSSSPPHPKSTEAPLLNATRSHSSMASLCVATPHRAQKQPANLSGQLLQKGICRYRIDSAIPARPTLSPPSPLLLSMKL
jgi:hypothetical protein